MQQLRPASKSAATRQACAEALLDMLPGLMRFVRCQMRSRRAPGLSIPQFRMLVQLHRRPSTSLSAVAEAIGSTAPTASRMISGLVRKGFIVRRESKDDRRQVSLALTPKGEEAMQAAWSGTKKVMAEQLAGLSDPSLNELRRALDSLSSVFTLLSEPCGVDAPKAETHRNLPSRVAKTRLSR